MDEVGLNDLQVEVLQTFFSLPASDGFVLAGGAGLVAVGLSSRPTEDLDLFSASASVTAAADALEAALDGRGWRTERIRQGATFRRIVVTTDDDDQVLVDLARDAAPLGRATITPVGPTYPAVELAARKVLALFDRAALRDFVDVALVVKTFDRQSLVVLASEIDEGFDLAVFVGMLDTLERFTDEEIATLTPAEPLRSFFSRWARHLRAGWGEGHDGAIDNDGRRR